MDCSQPTASRDPPPTAAEPITRAAVLALDARGRPIISVHAKLSYLIREDGRCERSELQAELLGLTDDPEAPPESDVIPHKAATDLIVMASAWAPRGRKVKHMIASIESLPVSRQFVVNGDRRVQYRGRGSLAFSEPEPFEQIPLRYENAYGGRDPYVTRPAPTTLLEAMDGLPGVYPRNPAGRGYVVHENAELLERLVLPNIEDPSQPLTAATLICGAEANWWRMPQPWSCDWFHLTWYPRSLYVGDVPEFLPEDDSQVAEVERGYAPGRQWQRFRETELSDLVDPRLADAASPGFVVPFMRGDELIRLRGLTPNGSLVVTLPGERPHMEVVLAGRSIALEPVLNRVLLSTDEMGVYMVWHGGYVLPESIAEAFDEQDVPIEVYIDGQPASLID